VDSLTTPIERVVEGSEWFVRTPSLRLLYVATSELVRKPVLAHLTAAEMLDANTCPFFVLEAVTEPSDDGWEARSVSIGRRSSRLRHRVPTCRCCGSKKPLNRRYWTTELSPNSTFDISLVRFGFDTTPLGSIMRLVSSSGLTLALSLSCRPRGISESPRVEHETVEADPTSWRCSTEARGSTHSSIETGAQRVMRNGRRHRVERLPCLRRSRTKTTAPIRMSSKQRPLGRPWFGEKFWLHWRMNSKHSQRKCAMTCSLRPSSRARSRCPNMSLRKRVRRSMTIYASS